MDMLHGLRASVFTGLSTTIDTYQQLIDSFDVADRIYVETTGDDGTGDGSQGNPYKTRAYAVSVATPGDAIIYGAGEFAATNQNQGSLAEVMCGTDYDGFTHIGAPNGTVFTESADNGQRDNIFIGTSDENTLFAFIHFKRNNNGRTDTYKVSIISNQPSTAAKGAALGCIFEELNANGNISLSYNNSGTSVFELSRCLFIASTWLAPLGSAETGITVKHCAATSVADYGTTSTTENNIDDVTLDADYRFVLDAGVYSGTNDWDDAAARQTLIDSFAVADRIYVETTGDDVSGDGTISAPLQTYAAAISQATAGQIIILGPGSFDHSGELISTAYSGLATFFSDNLNDIVTIGHGKDTIINDATTGAASTAAHKGIFGTTSTGSKWVSLTINANFGSGSSSNKNLIFRDLSADVHGELLNCVLNIDGGSGTAAWCRGGTAGTFKIYNSTLNFNWFNVTTTSPAGCGLYNSVATGAHYVGTGSTDTGNISNITIDAEYRLAISQGVYSGFYNWDGWDKSGSIKFDGSGDYLRADTALDAFTSTTDPWTIEIIFTSNNVTTTEAILGLNKNSDGADTFLYEQSRIYVENTAHNFSTSPTQDQEHFVAICYDGADFECYLDNTRVVNVTDALPVALQDLVFGIGCEFDGGSGGSPGNYFEGEISQLRVSDIARHTGATITAPEFLDKDNNTEFLLWPDPLFKDHGGNGHVITKYGDVKI